MLGEVLIAIGVFIGAIMGVLLGLKVGIPNTENRREAVNKLIKKGMNQEEAENKVDKNSKILRKIYYSIIAVGAVIALFGGLAVAFCNQGGV